MERGLVLGNEVKCDCCKKPVVRSDARRGVGRKSSNRLVPVFLDFFERTFSRIDLSA